MARRDGLSPETRQQLIAACYRVQRFMLKILQALPTENPTPAQVTQAHDLIVGIDRLDQIADNMTFRAKLDPE